MRIAVFAASLLLSGIAASAALAAAPTVMSTIKGDPQQLDIGSMAAAGGVIPTANSQYGDNTSLDVYWTGGPMGTKSYVVLIEDVDAVDKGKPLVHWLVFNIPDPITHIPAGGWDDTPAGVEQGAGIGGATYAGPKPPKGPAHHYHVEVFGLDTILKLTGGATREQVAAAMAGHVNSAGEAVFTYQQGQPE